MKSYEMVETLSEKTKVSLAQAKEALEKSNWDMLDAAIYIEKNKSKANDQPSNIPNNGYVSSQQKEVSGQYNTPHYTHYSGASHSNSGSQTYGNSQFGSQFNGNYSHNEAYNVPPYDQKYNQPPVSVGEMLGRLCGNIENIINKALCDSFVISRNGKRIFQIPLLIFLIFILFAFFPVIPLIILGLFFDFKYSFEGRSVGREPLNDFLNKAKNTADKVKDDFRASREDMKEEYEKIKEDFHKEYDVIKQDFKKGKDSTKM